MKNLIKVFWVLLFLLLAFNESYSFSPKGKTFGFGIMLGEPTGLTGKYWLEKDKALAFALGNSYLGNLRIGADYLFHFNAFESRIVNLYAGPGMAMGLGDSGGWWYKDKKEKWYKDRGEIGIGIRGVCGINIVPKNSPLEIFIEAGLMIGIVPGLYSNFEGAAGIRFYP